MKTKKTKTEKKNLKAISKLNEVELTGIKGGEDNTGGDWFDTGGFVKGHGDWSSK